MEYDNDIITWDNLSLPENQLCPFACLDMEWIGAVDVRSYIFV